MPSTAATTATWSEQSFQDALQIIAEGLTELVGFGMAVISVRRDDRFVVVALAGADTARRASGAHDSLADILGASWPASRLQRLLDVAEDWGRFKFVPHERAPRDSWMWVREAEAVEGPDAWHPNDGALAPIHDAAGRLVGAISVDDPRTGRQPDAAQRRVMDRYAAQAAKVVLSALEREALERRLKLAESTRQLIRTASRHLALDALLDETGPAFLEAFAASGLWLRIHGSAETVISAGRRELPPGMPPAAIADTVAEAAERLWERQRAAVVYTDGRGRDTVLVKAEVDAIRQVLADAEVGSVLHAPIGAGGECLGSLILVRDVGEHDWSGAEVDQAAEVGRDLGRIIRNGRTYSRVQELVRELRALDAHKSHLIAMISHELKNPLTVLMANRDVLEPELAGDPAALERLADIDTCARRMGGVVDNLLLLAKLADPETPHDERDVDLRPLLDEVVASLATSLAQRGVSLLTTAEGPLVVRGDAGELRTMLANLIGNGVKFSHAGGVVEVSAARSTDGLEVAVTDRGIGISADDREQLFSDFFRSQDPAALERPGSGLGLAIVDRILRRHRGRAEVASTLGQGTVVRIYLPAPGPAERVRGTGHTPTPAG